MGKDSNSAYERYKLLVAARNFHYDNFNKWMTFFYIAVGTLFVGYCSLVTNANIEDVKFEIILLTILGYIASLAWYLSAKGYYYWYTNFVVLINKYEKEYLGWLVDERVYSVISEDNNKNNNNYMKPWKGANISTSKIAILLPYIISIAWSGLFVKNLYITINCCGVIIMVLIFIALIFGLPLLGKFLKSNIKVHENI